MTHHVPSILPAYDRDAAVYDDRTASYQRYRDEIVDGMTLSSGETVLDVGCGTGLCFGALLERVGPGGRVIGVDAAPDMVEIAARRVSDAGWTNVELVCAPVEEAQLPTADHVLFCAAHDVLQSPAAVDAVLAQLRHGGRVAAGGGKWAPPWAVALNAGVLALHAPYVRDFTGFDRPWALLAERVPDLVVREVAMSCGWVAHGRVLSA